MVVSLKKELRNLFKKRKFLSFPNPPQMGRKAPPQGKGKFFKERCPQNKRSKTPFGGKLV